MSAENSTEFPMRIGETARFGDGWAAVGHNDDWESAQFDENSLVLIDGEGRITRVFTVGADGER